MLTEEMESLVSGISADGSYAILLRIRLEMVRESEEGGRSRLI